MRKLLLLLPALFACTTAANKTSATSLAMPTDLYTGSFHKSYQYYIKNKGCLEVQTQVAEQATKSCEMNLELHYFVDTPFIHSLASLTSTHAFLFSFFYGPDYKVEKEGNEVSISSDTEGKWYRFEEKTEDEKSLLWIRVGYVDDEKPMVADVVLNITDASQPRSIYPIEAREESEEINWNEIKKSLKLK